MLSNTKSTFLLKASVVFTASSIFAGAAFAQSAVVKVDGSSTVFPVTEAVAEEFQKANKNIKVTVGISGTGGGFKKFCRGETDISNASRPILAKEMAECKANGIEYIELPVAFDALTVVINPKNKFASTLTIAELKTMWEPAAQGKITNWNQVNPKFPSAPLKLYGAGSDSGTFDYFTEAVNEKAKSSRGDYTATEDDHVTVKGVAGDVNAIGYLGFAYFEENKKQLQGVSISWKGGKPVSPSPEHVLDGTYQPLSRPIMIYVNAASLKKPEVKAFAQYYMNNGAKMAKEVKYVELPASAYKIGLNRINNVIKGTAFGGENQVGIKIDEFMKRQPKL